MVGFDYEVFIDSLKESIVLSDFSYELYESLIKKYPEAMENTTIHCDSPFHLCILSKNKKYIIRIQRRFFNISRITDLTKIVDFISFRQFGKDMSEEDRDYILKYLFNLYEKE